MTKYAKSRKNKKSNRKTKQQEKSKNKTNEIKPKNGKMGGEKYLADAHENVVNAFVGCAVGIRWRSPGEVVRVLVVDLKLCPAQKQKTQKHKDTHNGC